MLNIEKSKFRRGEYVGYAGGLWFIRKTNSSYGNWIARHRDNTRLSPIYAATLEDMSRKLEANKDNNAVCSFVSAGLGED
jgi:hypothetical protein